MNLQNRLVAAVAEDNGVRKGRGSDGAYGYVYVFISIKLAMDIFVCACIKRQFEWVYIARGCLYDHLVQTLQ